MNKSLIQKIIIGALASSTIAVSVAMAVIINTNVTVTLRAGEGSFKNNRKSIVLYNIRPGTNLNTISGYKLPDLNNEDFTFDNWLDENREYKVVEQNAKITHNMVLVASYAHSLHYYREKYTQDIKNEAKDVIDYATTWQIVDFAADNVFAFMRDKTVELLSDLNINSPKHLEAIYCFTHNVFQKIDSLAWLRGCGSVVREEIYNYIFTLYNMFKETSSELNINLKNEKQWETFISLNNAYLNTYFNEDRSFAKNALNDYCEKLSGIQKDIDFKIVRTIDASVINACQNITKAESYSWLQSTAKQLLENIQKKTKDENQLNELLELTGNYLSSIGKIKETELDLTEITELYNKAIEWCVSSDFIARIKYQIAADCFLSASKNVKPFIAYNFISHVARFTLDGLDEWLKEFTPSQEVLLGLIDIYKKIDLVIEKNGIATDEYGDSCVNTLFTITDDITKKYYNGLYPIDFCLNIIDVLANRIPHDITEYKADGFNIADTMLHSSVFYDSFIHSYEQTRTLYADNIQNIPLENIPAFKKLMLGVFATGLYGQSEWIDNLYSNSSFTQILGKLKEQVGPLKAYAFANLGYHFCLLISKGQATYYKISNIQDSFKNIDEKFVPYIDNCSGFPDSERAIAYSEIVGLLFSKLCAKLTWLVGETGLLEVKYDHFDTILNLFNRIKDVSNEATFKQIVNLITVFLNTDRIYSLAAQGDFAADINYVHRIIGSEGVDFINQVIDSINDSKKYEKAYDIVINGYVDGINRLNDTRNSAGKYNELKEQINKELAEI